LPVLISFIPHALGLPLSAATVEHLNTMTVGAIIIFFLIVEPHGLARLWGIIREKLIMWPFPH
ncbi:branched-chain amino acid ABC transporter permease, partial [Salmonella enterica subsp. enterica]|nr:branched-chain amino acid ABC transporter permease [Salmonella enterica subsp. enterica]